MAAVQCSKLVSNIPIVVVLGATGTGKSKLALQIARRFKGEIINADSMQIYQGLDIATNKVTEDEQREVPHHLLGFLKPNEMLTVFKFRSLALEAMSDILKRKKLPVIVGGTNYYIESVLYDMLVEIPDDVSSKKAKLSFSELDTETLFEKLKEVDPERTNILHPNDRRRIIRCLEIYEQSGESLTSLMRKQGTTLGGYVTERPLVLPNSVILWLNCDFEILNKRLDDRVDAMMDQGLIGELTEFHKAYNAERSSEDQSFIEGRGIFQSIGFKEFHEYLSLDEGSRESEEGVKLLEKGVELLKIATRQYARRQHKWIDSRFIKNSLRQIPPFYGLDATDVTKWDENVYKKAEEIVAAYLEGREPSVEPLPLSNTRVGVDKTYKCEVCNRVVLGIHQWEAHIKGRKHAFVVKRKQKLLKLEEEKSLDDKPVSCAV